MTVLARNSRTNVGANLIRHTGPAQIVIYDVVAHHDVSCFWAFQLQVAYLPYLQECDRNFGAFLLAMLTPLVQRMWPWGHVAAIQ